MTLNDEKVAALKEIQKLEEKLMFVGLMLAVDRTDSAEKMLQDSLKILVDLAQHLDDIFMRERQQEKDRTRLH